MLPAVLLALAPGASMAHGNAGAGDTLTVLFTGETRGNLLPCACPDRALGGLARRTEFLKRTAAARSRGGPVLRLDSGGFLPEGDVPLRDDPEVAARLVRLLVQAFRRSEMDAIALDHRMRGFLDTCAPTESRSVASALLDADPPGHPRRFSWGRETITVLALDESLSDSVVIASAGAARSASDFLIVLARADAFTGRRLARLSGADLVLLSRGARPVEPLLEARTVLAGCGVEGREVGEIRLVRELSPPNAALTLRVVDFRLHPMDERVGEDPELSRGVRKLLNEAGPGAVVQMGE